MNGILKKIHEDLAQLVFIRQDFEILWNGVGECDRFEFVGQEAFGVEDDAMERRRELHDFVAPGEGSKVGDDPDHPAEGIIEILKGFVEVLLLVGVQLGPECFEEVERCLGVVQRVVDLMDNTGTHLPE